MGCQCNSNNNKNKNNSKRNKNNTPQNNTNIKIDNNLYEKSNLKSINEKKFNLEEKSNIQEKKEIGLKKESIIKTLKKIKIPSSILIQIEKNFTFINENNKKNPNLYLNDTYSISLGPGYKLKYRNEDELIIDLTEAGFNKENIDKLIKAMKLTGEDAKKFCEENKNIEISEENKKKLFKQIYPFYQLSAKKILESEGDVNYDKIPDNVKEFVNDLRFRGDLSGKNIEKCREAVKQIIYEKDYSKLKQFSDELYEKTKKKIPKRAENRKELIKEIISKNTFDLLDSSLNSTQSSEEININLGEISEEQKKNALGGIDLNADYDFDNIIKNADKIKLQGIFEKNSQMFFFQAKK